MKHKLFLSILSLFFLLSNTSIIHAQPPQAKIIRVSPFATVLQTIGATDVTVTYHRPGVKGREIWGKLVPYNQVWRAGANNATTFDFSQDVTIAGTKLKAGKYSFFVIPTENEWKVIFNSNADQWGAYSYDSTKNVLIFSATPEVIPHEEWLSYSFSELDAYSAKLSLRWEKLSLSFTISTETDEVLKKLEAQTRSVARDQAASFARYAFDNKVQWEKGMESIERALAIEKTFGLLQLKANLQAQKELFADAVKTGEDAVKFAKEQNPNTNTTGFEKTIAEWKSKIPPTKGKKK